jgi:hypothetical protein
MEGVQPAHRAVDEYSRMRLPPETWSLIFEHATAVPGVLDVNAFTSTQQRETGLQLLF